MGTTAPPLASPSSGSPSSLDSSDEDVASSGDEDETLAHAKERLMREKRELRAAKSVAASAVDDDDILQESAAKAPNKRRRLKKIVDDSSDADDENDSSAEEQQSAEEEEEQEDEDAEEESEDPYVRLGLRKATPPAPLLSEAAAHGAVWAYTAPQSRPKWSTAHLSCDAAEAEQRRNDLSLAGIESELSLSKHETHQTMKPALPGAAPAEPSLTAGFESSSFPPPLPSSAAAMRTDNTTSDSATPLFTAAPARRHLAHLPSTATAARSGSVGARRGPPGSGIATGGLTRLMQGRFPARNGLNPSIRGATIRQIPHAPQALRDATGSSGLQALAHRHGWKMVTSGGAQRPPERVEKSRRQFLAATSSAAAQASAP